MNLWGIWCKEDVGWLRERGSDKASMSNPILAFECKQAACNRAAELYGFMTYSAVKKADWCEVRPLK